MKDELQDFLQQQRAAMDDKQPRQSLWTNIETQLMGKQVNRFAIRYWQVAAALLFAVCVYQFSLSYQSSISRPVAVKEFSDIEAFYGQQITDKMDLIRTISANSTTGFSEDMQQMEAMYMVLKEELVQHPSEKVKDAMILNLLVRINLLNQQLHQLEVLPSDKKQI